MLTALRSTGFDVVAVGDVQRGVPDRFVLAMARESGRWLITLDRDYGELILKYGEAPPVGILFLRQRARRAPTFAAWVRAAIEPADQRARLQDLAVLDGRSVRLRRFPKAQSTSG